MFKNVGEKIRVVAIVFFTLLCVASFLLLVAGVINGVSLGWAWPIIGGVAGAAVGFVFSLISTYMLYGYGTLIKSCEDNARINAEILEILRNNGFNRAQPAQHAQPAQPARPVQDAVSNEKTEAFVADEVEDVKVYEVAPPADVEETVGAEVEAAAEEPVSEVVEEAAAEPQPLEAPIAEEPFVEDLFSGTAKVQPPSPSQGGEPLVRRCPTCGNVVRPQANFCNQCGRKMK